MKFEQVYQLVVMSCGLILSIGGVGCMVVGALLDNDIRIQTSSEARSRNYKAQYWLGLPLIVFGIKSMALAIAQKGGKMIVISLFASIPLIGLTFVGAILHGASYTHFLSIERKQNSLLDLGYICLTDKVNQCRCRNVDSDQSIVLPIECEQDTLLAYHEAIFALGITSFALVFGVLIINIISLFNKFTSHLIQLPANSHSVENRGFSQQEDGNGPSIPQEVDQSQNGQIHLSQQHLNTSHDDLTPSSASELPPSYESLLTTFHATNGVPVMNIGSGPSHLFHRSLPDVNRHARVEYRGEANSDTDSFHIGGSGGGLSGQNTGGENGGGGAHGGGTSGRDASGGGTSGGSDVGGSDVGGSAVDNRGGGSRGGDRAEGGGTLSGGSDGASGARGGVSGGGRSRGITHSLNINEAVTDNSQNNAEPGTHGLREHNSPTSSEMQVIIDIPQTSRNNTSNHFAAVHYRSQSDSSSRNAWPEDQSSQGTTAQDSTDLQSSESRENGVDHEIDYQEIPQEDNTDSAAIPGSVVTEQLLALERTLQDINTDLATISERDIAHQIGSQEPQLQDSTGLVTIPELQNINNGQEMSQDHSDLERTPENVVEQNIDFETEYGGAGILQEQTSAMVARESNSENSGVSSLDDQERPLEIQEINDVNSPDLSWKPTENSRVDILRQEGVFTHHQPQSASSSSLPSVTNMGEPSSSGSLLPASHTKEIPGTYPTHEILLDIIHI